MSNLSQEVADTLARLRWLAAQLDAAGRTALARELMRFIEELLGVGGVR